MNECLFCAILAGDVPAQFVLDEPEVAAFLDVRPLFKGHALVLPRAHYETLADLPAGLLGPLFGWVQAISAAMPAAYGAQGSFVAINNTVSQSVPHLHVHVVPRTKGDGLRGFFWPRGRYASDEEAAQYARRMRETLAGSADRGDASADRGDGSADRGDGSADRGDGSADRGDGSADRGDGSADRGDGSADRGDEQARGDGDLRDRAEHVAGDPAEPADRGPGHAE